MRISINTLSAMGCSETHTLASYIKYGWQVWYGEGLFFVVDRNGRWYEAAELA